MLTSLEFLAPRQPWPPKCELARLKEYEDNRKLFERKHGEIFKDWIRLVREDQKAALLIVLNWHKRLSTLWADLLLGEPPRIRAGEPESGEQLRLEQIVEQNRLYQTGYAVAIDISRFGTGIFRLRYDGRGIIEGQTPTVWFPVLSPDNVKNLQYHVLGWAFTEGGKHYLKIEVHEKGRITHRLFLLQKGSADLMDTIKDELPLAALPRYASLKAVEETGVDDFLIFPVAGVVTTDLPNGIGPDDYGDIEPIVQEIMVRFSQIARILDKHSDPNMSGPDTALEESEDEEGNKRTTFRAGGKYFPISPGDPEPKYVTWEAQLEANFREIEMLLAQLYILSETSPAAFGQLEQGLAESGSALRRLMMAPLAKVNRIRLNFDPTLKDVIQTCAALERANAMKGAVLLPNLNIEWRDGLPEDVTETVNQENIAYTAGLSSRETSIKRLRGLEGPALQEEIDRIKTEKQEAAALIAPPGEKPNPKLPDNQQKMGE